MQPTVDDWVVKISFIFKQCLKNVDIDVWTEFDEVYYASIRVSYAFPYENGSKIIDIRRKYPIAEFLDRLRYPDLFLADVARSVKEELAEALFSRQHKPDKDMFLYVF